MTGSKLGIIARLLLSCYGSVTMRKDLLMFRNILTIGIWPLRLCAEQRTGQKIVFFSPLYKTFY